LSSGPRKGWDLTQEAFDEVLAWLHPDREQAARKYEAIRNKLIRIFMYRGCTPAEVLADKTINQVTKKVHKIKDTYEGDPALYFYGAARNIINDYFKNLPDEVPVTPEILAAPPADEPDESEREHECLEKCLGVMTQPDRELLLEYYREDGGAKIEHHKEMARRRGVTLNALRILACRLRARFKECMRECLKAEAA
jgi:DNA-directed RNA polymerase specialized sigma24 family protein